MTEENDLFDYLHVYKPHKNILNFRIFGSDLQTGVSLHIRARLSVHYIKRLFSRVIGQI